MFIERGAALPALSRDNGLAHRAAHCDDVCFAHDAWRRIMRQDSSMQITPRCRLVTLMPWLPPSRRAICSVLAALAGMAVAAIAADAQAQAKLTAQYTISMTGISIGQLAWLIDIGDDTYATSASGSASGVLSVLVNGEGSVVTRGLVSNGHLAPTTVSSHVTDDEGTTELRMTFDGGAAKLLTPEPPGKPDRVPVSEADRAGVVDPLTAMLIPVAAGGDLLAHEGCNRTLPIFDGRRRYDLALSFKRTDTIKIAHGYAGPVLVCGAVLRPISGHSAKSMLVKYVAGRHDVELWFAPVAGAHVIAPIRVSMPTLVGTLGIQADQFEAAPARAMIEPDAARR
jgi:hypothetical protein